MRQKSGPEKAPAEQVVKDIRRATRRQFSAEEKIRIVLEGVRGEESIAELCRREGIASSMYYGWSKKASAGSRRVQPSHLDHVAGRSLTVRKKKNSVADSCDNKIFSSYRSVKAFQLRLTNSPGSV